MLETNVKRVVAATCMSLAVAAALCLSPMAASQAEALWLPKGYGLSKKDAKSYSRKNMWRKIKTPKCWRTKVKVSKKKFMTWGVISKYGKTWTWYSQRVLPGGGLKIKGRHLDQRGYVVNWRGQIVIATNNLKRGTVIKTPFGADGIVLDDGCDGYDVYVSW